MERHLTCPFLDVNFQIAMDSPFYILPPGRLAGAAMLHLLQVHGEEKEKWRIVMLVLHVILFWQRYKQANNDWCYFVN